MELIIAALQKSANTESQPLIEKWYRLDENSLPPEYVLQPLTAIGKASVEKEALEELLNGTEEAMRRELLDQGRKQWRQEEPRVAAALRQGADTCIQEGSLTKAEAHVFTRSGTDYRNYFFR